jgi:hypothetical protein
LLLRTVVGELVLDNGAGVGDQGAHNICHNQLPFREREKGKEGYLSSSA